MCVHVVIPFFFPFRGATFEWNECVCLPLLTRLVVLPRPTCRLSDVQEETKAFKAPQADWMSRSSAGRNSQEAQRWTWTSQWASAWVDAQQSGSEDKCGVWLVSWKVVWWRFSWRWLDVSICMMVLQSWAVMETVNQRLKRPSGPIQCWNGGNKWLFFLNLRKKMKHQEEVGVRYLFSNENKCATCRCSLCSTSTLS